MFSTRERGQLPEPVDGSMVRFVKSGYGFVAVRSGDRWETSATQSVGFIDEVMAWDDMWLAGRYFELATALDPIKQPAERDKRLVEKSVVCFRLADEHWAAIAYQGSYTGFKQRVWYTTLTTAACKRAKLASCYGQWAEIMPKATDIQVVTSWKPLLPREVADTMGRHANTQLGRRPGRRNPWTPPF
ncbi:hypothetical protein MMAN_58100 [Mycobacterium mantenii]|uniref:Uncharacterized protein n=2 Tax=Mycobacterium mantenii TaxID=560555 RepID=A0ABM7K1D9_MYCNT|nr:hypothetical protein [Mycobacterium mantenii]MCV7243832.1 hypothetical protein [Mycobacterium mantenii]BBY41676.1 hypothetical protein MMAN_58100 [Mycobacterium mantenii]